MLEDALKYPLRGEESTATLLIGGGLAIAALVAAVLGVLLSFVFVGLLVLPFALVPGVFVQGYLVDVVRHRLDGDPDPPTFEDWSALFVDGLKMVLVGVVYTIPVVIGGVFFAIIAVALTYAMQGSPNTGSALGFALTALVFLALAVYGVLVGYVYPAAVANWVREDDVMAAFSIATLKEATLNTRYLVGWLLALVVAVVGNAVGQALLVLFFVGVFVIFYAQVVAWYCYAEAYADAMGLDREDGGASDDADGGAGDDGDGDRQQGYGALSYEAKAQSVADDSESNDAEESTPPTDAVERVEDGPDASDDDDGEERRE
ncbi:hypothetical protein GCM10009037_04650 [Halarchaeum grantii]|uniref:DUF4013 domain-containing protein n=1 Tax=Halarchaeum grantii TaxID=1193105 RepID=A0A830ERZ3_9EURY|nr:DUF4013 domain-containing protein [Halarchaeum grantii]GGL24194.1 hypothetical protein GCM10009037_04650 [Halarchaeum grantii]